MTAPGQAWVEFDRRLRGDWCDLATALAVPPHLQDRFERGEEAREIRHWLDRTGRLADLPEALEAIGRGDLIATVEAALRSGTRDPDPERPQWNWRRRAVLVSAVCLVLATGGTLTYLNRAHVGPPSHASPRSTASAVTPSVSTSVEPSASLFGKG